MKRIALIVVTGLLAACGADGPPIRPSANLGVSVGSGGISPTASVGATSGPVSLSMGL